MRSRRAKIPWGVLERVELRDEMRVER